MKKTLLSLFLIFCLMLSAVPALAVSADDLLTDAARYAEEGEIEKALACCQLAQRLNADDPTGFVTEAEILFQTRELTGARRAAQFALAADPVCGAAWRILCCLDIAKNDIAAFEEDALFASVLHVDLSDLYGNIAAMYAAAGRYETAISYFEMTDLGDLDENQRSIYASALKKSGQRDRAEALGLARVSTYNAALDAAFAQDRLTLVPADDLPFDGAATWYSISPAGNSGILIPEGSEDPVSLFEGVCHEIRPAADRGVNDEYGNLKKYISTRFSALLGAEGVVYSPDGRYAAILNTRITLQNAQYFIDPILLDLSTGELILTATYSNKIRLANGGVAATACFSSDGRYFYYMLFGNVVFRSTLARYDLIEQRTEICLYDPAQAFTDDGEARNYLRMLYYPRLSFTADGDLLILIDSISADEPQGILRISASGESWKSRDSIYLHMSDDDAGEVSIDEALSRYSLDVNDSLWTLDRLSFPLMGNFWYANRLNYSPNSERALVLGKSSLGACPIFLCPDFSAEVSGLDRFWAIDAATLTAVSLSAQEYMDVLQANLPKDYSSALSLLYLHINHACLSPDGHYALVLTSNIDTREAALYLIHLEDMELRPVRGIDTADISVGVASLTFAPMIEWNGDLLIIGTKDGIRTYRFEEE